MDFNHGEKLMMGRNCAFLSYFGKDPNSLHNKAIMQFRDLMNQAQYIPHVIEKQTSQQVVNNRLKASIDTVRWFILWACSLSSHNECTHLTNQSNFLELIKLLAPDNECVASIVLDNTPKMHLIPSVMPKKEYCTFFANKTICVILEKIGESKFCIIVDEPRDESKR